MASDLIMVLTSSIARRYRRLASKAMLAMMAESDPALAKNLQVEDQLSGNKRGIGAVAGEPDMDNTLIKMKREVEISEFELQIARNRELVGGMQTKALLRKIEIYDQIMDTIPAGLEKDKALRYIRNQKTNMAIRVSENISFGPSYSKQITENGEEAPDAVRDGQVLTIGMILHEKGVMDTSENKISKAIGKIAARLYRIKHNAEPLKGKMILADGCEIFTNSYKETDRDTLLQAYDEYANGVDLREQQQKEKQAAKGISIKPIGEYFIRPSPAPSS
jgi:hypothetical protein